MIEDNFDIRKRKKEDTSYRVQVTHPSLNVRSTPNNNSVDNIVSQITDKGIYKILEEQNGFGKLEDGNWIMLEFTERV